VAGAEFIGRHVCWLRAARCVSYFLFVPYEIKLIFQVVLDCHPFFTTLVIFSGWAIKTCIVGLVRDFIGPGNGVEETWLVYSIP
jgi:hypothetical protein